LIERNYTRAFLRVPVVSVGSLKPAANIGLQLFVNALSPNKPRCVTASRIRDPIVPRDEVLVDRTSEAIAGKTDLSSWQ
jgi:hypothetical protein